MAERPYFYVTDNFIAKRLASFEWFAGFAVSQKQKSIDSFHFEIKRKGLKPLEVSTKSRDELGKKLSAFNLKLNGYYLENIFQSSKVFEKGGPYVDLLDIEPKAAKKDERLRTSGALTGLVYNNEEWPLIPKTAFYDYIYYNAVRSTLSEDELRELANYNAFTDIEFNPNRSLNTQERAIAIVVFVYLKNGFLPEISKENFLKSHRMIVKD